MHRLEHASICFQKTDEKLEQYEPGCLNKYDQAFQDDDEGMTYDKENDHKERIINHITDKVGRLRGACMRQCEGANTDK